MQYALPELKWRRPLRMRKVLLERFRPFATLLSAHTDAATAKAMSEMEARVQQVASYSDAQTSQAAATLRQELESGMVSVAASADETAAKRTRDAEERIRREVEAKLQQEQATTRHQTDETCTAVEDIAAKLDQLTEQLNEYRPAQEATVTSQGERLSVGVEERFELQSSRLDNFAQSLQEMREEQQNLRCLV